MMLMYHEIWSVLAVMQSVVILVNANCDGGLHWFSMQQSFVAGPAVLVQNSVYQNYVVLALYCHCYSFLDLLMNQFWQTKTIYSAATMTMIDH